MDWKEFYDRYLTHLDPRLKEGQSRFDRGAAKRLAYKLTEDDHMALLGRTKFKHFESFQVCRANYNKVFSEEPKPKVKRKAVYKKTEWDSKFNWLF